MKQKSHCSMASKRRQLVLESDIWLSQCSGVDSCKVETRDTQTKLRTYGCGTMVSADSRRLINDEAANARVRWTPRGEEYDAAIRFEP